MDQGDGTCLEPAKTVMGAAPVVVPQPCPAGTNDMGNGTCEAPARIIQPEHVYMSAPAPAPVYTAPTTVVTGGEYCYGDGSATYDSNGRKIKNKSKKSKHSYSCNGHNSFEGGYNYEGGQ